MEAAALLGQFQYSEYCNLYECHQSTESTVYRATHRLTGRRVAMKVVDKRGPDGKRQAARLVREGLLLRDGLCHPNVAFARALFETEESACLVTDWTDRGDLLHMAEQRLPTGETLRAACLQIADALVYLHSLGIVHGDVKLDNILVYPDRQRRHPETGFRLVLSDFGFARRYEPGAPPSEFDRCGTPSYAAPEQFAPMTAALGPEIDVWAFGVILYALVANALPFMADTCAEVAQRVMAGHYDARPLRDPVHRGLVASLLRVCPSERPSMQSVRSHPWFSPRKTKPAVRSSRETVSPALIN